MKNKILHPAIFIICGIALCLGLIFTGGEGKILSKDSYFLASLFSPEDESKEPVLNQEELVGLAKPSVVRIVHQIKGELKMPAFDFYIDAKKFSLTFLQDRLPYTIPVDVDIMGSGFIVNPEGYILTNAHVVSEETIKYELVTERLMQTVLMGLLVSDPKSVEELEKTIKDDQEPLTKFVRQSQKEIVEKSTLRATRTLTVINPYSEKEKLVDLVKDSFPAEVLKINEGFFESEKDIALIKIQKNELPAIKLGSSQQLAVGKKIFVFGFPATATFNRKDFTEPTFTQGTISAFKDSENKDFKVLQTDAKVSEGSSGGPLFDDKGEVVGLTTYQSNLLSGAQGDNFAFAVPIEIAKEALSGASVENQLGNYGPHFKAGLAFSQNRRCKKAIAEFDLAKKTNESFRVDKYVDPHIKKCNELIASGKSIDSRWDEIREWLNGVGYMTWIIIGGGIFIVIVLVFIIIFLRKRLKKEEKEMDKLEARIEKEEAREAAREAKGGVVLNKTAIGSVGKAEIAPESKPVIQPAISKEKIIYPEQLISPAQPISLEREVSQGQPIFQEKPVQTGETLTHPQTSQPLTPEQKTVPNPAILQYILEARKSGLADEAISQALKGAGWSDTDIQSAFQIK